MARNSRTEAPAGCRPRTPGAARSAAQSAALSVLLLAAAPAPAPAVGTLEPRAFGYTVGDMLERRIQVDPAREGRIEMASLPKPGRAGRWFALREVAPADDGIRLRYQIVNTPAQPALENLPSVSFRIVGADGQARSGDIGPYTVAMAPVALFGPDEAIQSTQMRPDRDPVPIQTAARRRRVAAEAAALLALIAAGVAPRLARRWLRRRAGPFMRAWRSMRSVARQRDDPALRRQALRSLHQALDEAAGVTVALDNLDRLFDAAPPLVEARGRIESMLAASRTAFFGQGPAPAAGELLSLARQLAELETRSAR
jgi:mxaA protein